jgi:hypothetical protein
VLTVLQEKLAEAHGLAMAASVVVDKVAERTLDPSLRRVLRELQDDAAETRGRCLEAEEALGTQVGEAVLAHAQTTKEHAADLAAAWFKAGTGPLRAWSFLAMGESSEVAAWAAVDVLARRAEAGRILQLAEWALPLQRRHLEVALDGAVRLAGQVDPNGPRYG